jgi:hypothetical protein
MQGKERTDRELLDAGVLAGLLVPEGSMFAFLAAHPWLKRRTAAVNLRNLIGRGLARQAGAWALAAT